LILLITSMTCSELVRAIPQEIDCWENKSLEGFNILSLIDVECCREYVHSGGDGKCREYDIPCLLNLIMKSKHRELLNRLPWVNIALAVITSLPVIDPHGVHQLNDFPECLLEIWVNNDYLGVVEKTLYSRSLDLLGIYSKLLSKDTLFVPSPLLLALGEKLKDVNINRLGLLEGEKQVLNGVDLLLFNYSQKIDECVDRISGLCEESDQECWSIINEVKNKLSFREVRKVS
jgi:hypothetical protein